jgi:metal transporter CNNM
MGTILLVLTVIILISMSAICSGLNLSLMSLEMADLQRRAKNGSKQAKKVLPLRRNSHLSLASIVLSNVAIISATSLVLGNRFSGLVAGSISTLLIVVFGEIIPQALFIKNALKITARLSTLLRWMIIFTYPIAKPLQLLLDRLFGRQHTRLHSRRELGMIISEHVDHRGSELDQDEIEIMRGALGLSDKHVRDITTTIENVYWLSPDTVIDAAKIDEIKAENWSRIPVFNTNRTESYGVLLMKDLVDIDFDEQSLRVDELPLKPTEIVGSMTALDTMFRKFIGAHTHLMPVEKNDVIIGIVTIEDLIEEIIGHEIQDESDD